MMSEAASGVVAPNYTVNAIEVFGIAVVLLFISVVIGRLITAGWVNEQ